jgi:phage pi2 protein 07
MFAEGKLSNNIATGKCWTIAELRYAILRKNGIDEKNIFILRSNKLGHEICIFKFQSETYITDNQRIKQISKLSPEKKDKYIKRPVSWFYWETFFSKSSFTLDFEKIDQTNTLYEYFKEVSKDQWKIQDLKERIPESDMDELVKYGLQDTEVATKLHNRNDICTRIKDNIKERTSIFNEENRIMSPDQVIVFKQWTARDRAMLGHILSNLLQISTKITEENKVIYDKKEYIV